jgi:hypothetical protein
VRSSSRAEEESWQISRQVASRLQYLGIQDAPRKQRLPVRNPGAWAGALFSTSEGKITQTVSQAKWDKGKRQVGSLCAPQDPKSPLNYKELERTRGLLCHLSMTFELITPFQKGVSSHYLGPSSKTRCRRLEDCGTLLGCLCSPASGGRVDDRG